MTNWIAAARAVGSEVAARHADDVDMHARFPKESFAALKEHKLLGILVPASEGGGGAGIADVVSVCHVLGQYCAATAMIYAMHQIQVSCIVRHGGDWHRGFAKRLAEDQLLLASATSEAGIGGDVRSSICALEEKGSRFSLSKQATVISYGADADGILVTARRTPQSPASDQVIVVLPRSGAAFEALQGWDTLGMRGTCSNGYHLKAEGEMAQVIPVPYADVSAQTMLPTSHLVWSALWLGIATDAVARARSIRKAAEQLNVELKRYGDEVVKIVQGKAARISEETLANVYAENFTEEELRQLTTFFASATVKKYQGLTPQLSNAVVQTMVEATRADIQARAKTFEEAATRIVGADKPKK